MVSNCFAFIGDAAEALIFSYLGLTAFSYKEKDIDYVFIFLIIISSMVARLFATLVLIKIAGWISKGKYNMSYRAISIV